MGFRKMPSRNHQLWAIAVHQNPAGFQVRSGLTRDFIRHWVVELQGNLIIVECALGDRDFEVTSKNSSVPIPGQGQQIHLQVRTNSELWHKENLINLGMQHLPDDCKYVAWIDADIVFNNRQIIRDTVTALQQHRVVQMFQHCNDLGPDGEIMQVHTSFGYCYQRGDKLNANGEYGGPFWHPGFAHAARRDCLDAMGGLYETSLVGSADHHMALAIIGEVERSIHGATSPEYQESLHAWQTLALEIFERDFGYVKGTILHNFHGFKADRKYNSRWSILIDSKFTPKMLRRNLQGVLELAHNCDYVLRDNLRKYFRARNEDARVQGDYVPHLEI